MARPGAGSEPAAMSSASVLPMMSSQRAAGGGPKAKPRHPKVDTQLKPHLDRPYSRVSPGADCDTGSSSEGK